MMLFIVLAVFHLMFGESCGSVTVPDGIEKYSNDYIRNGSSYYLVYTFGALPILSIDKFLYPDLNRPADYFWIFDPARSPAWVDTSQSYEHPDINVIGPGMVRVYFDAVDNSTNLRAIGVGYTEALDLGNS